MRYNDVRMRRVYSSMLRTGSCLRLINSCITQRKAQGPSRTCNESQEEGEEDTEVVAVGMVEHYEELHLSVTYKTVTYKTAKMSDI